MKLVILGSGTCVPSLKRSAPAYFFEADDPLRRPPRRAEGETGIEASRQILIDCGSGAMLQLQKAGKSYKDVDAVFITHTHPDHIAGLVPLIHALLATPLFTREKELLIAGPVGLKSFYLNYIESVLPAASRFVRVVEINDGLDYPPLKIISARTVHSENSLAFRFQTGDKSVVITGDADFDAGLVKLSKDCDIMIADCSFPESMKAKGHMTPRECGLVAKEAGVRRLILSHIHTLPVPDAVRIEECRAVYNGEIILAEDLMEFQI